MPQAAEFAGRVGVFDLAKIAKEVNPGLRVEKGRKGEGDRTGQGQASREGKRREVAPIDDNLPPGKEGEEIVKKEIQKLVKESERKGLSEEQRKKLESQLKQQRATLSRDRKSVV